MLQCTRCQYDLSGLVKGDAPVWCPECGYTTPHRGGESVEHPDFAVWNMLGPRRWLAILGPAFVGVMATVLPIIGAGLDAILGNSSLLRDVSMGMTLVAPMLAWVGSVVYFSRGLRRAVHSERRMRYLWTYAAASGAVAAFVCGIVWPLSLAVFSGLVGR